MGAYTSSSSSESSFSFSVKPSSSSIACRSAARCSRRSLSHCATRKASVGQENAAHEWTAEGVQGRSFGVYACGTSPRVEYADGDLAGDRGGEEGPGEDEAAMPHFCCCANLLRPRFGLETLDLA